MKLLVNGASSTEGMYGYSAIGIPLTKENLEEIKKLSKLSKGIENLSKEFGQNIANICLNLTKLVAKPIPNLNSVEFEDDEIQEVELSEKDLTINTTDFSITRLVYDPVVKVGTHGFTVCFYGKFCSDELWCSFNFNDFEKYFEKDLVDIK